MCPLGKRSAKLLLGLVVCLVFPTLLIASDQATVTSDQPALTNEQIKEFLLTAKIVGAHESKKGVTQTSRLTLSDGKLTHDASFQAIDEHEFKKQLAGGVTEMNFVDSYKYNIAGYELAELLGLDDMVPVYVERKWQGKTGSLSWWLPVMMDDQERYKRKIEPPNQDDWNRQMYKIRVFDQLIYDTDPNLTNILITREWKLWRIDFTRGFRQYHELQNPKDLVRCDRQLLEKLKSLNASTLGEKTQKYLTKSEIQAIMARRDKIVAHFQQLIAAKGEQEVLY